MTSNEVVVQFELSGVDRERLVLIGGDLEYLRDLPIDRLLTHTEVRLAAGILRRLLVDGQIDSFWRHISAKAKVQPSVEVTEIDTALSKWPHRWIKYAWAGGANPQLAAHHTGFIFAAIPQEEHEQYDSVETLFEQNPIPMTGQKVRFTLADWLRSTSVAVMTNERGLVAISRRSVLKYIANRKGGVHFDPKRDLTVGSAKRKQESVEHHLLDHGLLRVGHLTGPEFEVASMVRAVRDSDWAEQIIATAKTAAPREFEGDPLELKFWTGIGSDDDDEPGWATSRMGPSAPDAPPSAD